MSYCNSTNILSKAVDYISFPPRLSLILIVNPHSQLPKSYLILHFFCQKGLFFLEPFKMYKNIPYPLPDRLKRLFITAAERAMIIE